MNRALSGSGRPVVHVIDDDASVRRSLARLLRSADYVAETFESAEAWLDRADESEPACLVLDVRMPGLDGPALHARLVETPGIPTPVVFLTGHGTIPMAAREFKRGAVDFLTKPVDEKDLLPAIATAISVYEGKADERDRVQEARGRLDSLTPRELQVLRFVISGLRNKQIAMHLSIAEKTVKVHRGRVLAKLGVSSVAELVNLCAIAGITPFEIPGSS